MREPGPAMRAIELAIFTVALTVAGLIVAALAWSGTGPYADLARANDVTTVEMLSHGPGGDVIAPQSLDALLELHRQWSTYVTGGTELPAAVGRSLWTDDEYSHMADVRRVFEAAKFLVPVSLFVIIIRLQRARARSPRAMWELVRGGSVIAAAVVLLIGIVATFAFDPLFLAFHHVFFPQGNFLFDPATSNLIRLYPDWYWQGISLRVGLSFIAFGLGVAGVAALRLRPAK